MRALLSYIALAVGIAAGSAFAASCDGFTDVDAAASYCTAVVYLKDHGITLGCTGTTYCPSDFVTRAQMALFLQRMGRADPSNTVGDHTGTIGGGTHNTTSAVAGNSTVGGGNNNSATGPLATVVGGGRNTASGEASTVVGGFQNVASGDFSFAAGLNAVAAEDGMFVWADSSNDDFDPTTFRSAGLSANTFNVRATAGVFLATGIDVGTGAPTWACYTVNGAGWSCTSDRNVKRNLQRVDSQDVLSQLAAMPIYHWQPKDGPNRDLRHVGPMAQDFYATFGLGDSDKAIGMQDAEGIALAAIQGLNAKLEARDAVISDQTKALIALQARVESLEHGARH